MRERQDYESVLDDLFRDQPVPSVQYNYNDSERENRLAQESPAEWINSPQNYSPLSDLSGTARPPSFQSIPTEPARGQPPPYETVKNERVNVSPVQDIELPSYSGSIVRYNQNRSRPGRHERGPYGQYKDDSGKIDITKINDPEEKRKVLEKREKNRIAAARARNRKKERTEELEEQESLLRSRIAATESDLERLRHLRHKLHVVSQEHEKLCQFLNQYR